LVPQEGGQLTRHSGKLYEWPLHYRAFNLRAWRCFTM